jgi:hypothetical protein
VITLPILERNLQIWGRATSPWRPAFVIFLLQLFLLGASGGVYGLVQLFWGPAAAAEMMRFTEMRFVGMGFHNVILALIYTVAVFMTCAAGVMVVHERDRRTWEMVTSSPIDPARVVIEGIVSGMLRGGAVIIAFLPMISIVLLPWMRGAADVFVVVSLVVTGICVSTAASFYSAIIYDPSDPYWHKILSRGGRLASQSASGHVFVWGFLAAVIPLFVAGPLFDDVFRSGTPPGPVTVLPIGIIHPLISVWTRLNLYEPGIPFFGRPRPEWMVVLCVQLVMAGLLITHSILRLRRVRDDRSIAHRAMILLECFGLPLALAGFAWPEPTWPRLADARNAAGVSVEIVALVVAYAAGHIIVRGGLRRKWWESYTREPLFRQCAENAHRFAPLVALATLPALLCAMRLQAMGLRGFGILAALILATVSGEASWQQVRRRFDTGIPGRFIEAVNSACVWAIWIAPLLVIGAFQQLEEPRRWLYLFAIWPPFAPLVLLLDLCSGALGTSTAVGMGEKALALALAVQLGRWGICKLALAMSRDRMLPVSAAPR